MHFNTAYTDKGIQGDLHAYTVLNGSRMKNYNQITFSLFQQKSEGQCTIGDARRALQCDPPYFWPILRLTMYILLKIFPKSVQW